MSWSYTGAGAPKDVAACIDGAAGTYCPQGLKDFVKELAKRVPDDKILFVDTNGHIENRLPPEKQYDNAASVAAGKSLAKDGTDYDASGGDYVWGSGVLTFKIMPKAEAPKA